MFRHPLPRIRRRLATEQIVKHLQDRCYEDAEYKYVYKPEECTYAVKFHVFSIEEWGDVRAGEIYGCLEFGSSTC
jgi:hypothetical protein